MGAGEEAMDGTVEALPPAEAVVTVAARAGGGSSNPHVYDVPVPGFPFLDLISFYYLVK
jgi:hypothetical protein